MQKIIVERAKLRKKLMEIERDGMDLVELRIVPCQTEEEEMHPAFLHLEGVSKRGARKDYESVDEFSGRTPLYIIQSA